MAEHQQAQKSTESKPNIQTQTTLPKQIPTSHPAAIIQRAKINPKSLTHADVMQLQRTIGNQAVGRLLSEIGLIPSKAKQAHPVQMQTIPEEEKEPLQGKFAEPLQRQEIPEEEEPLQGKFESGHEKEICPSCIQRQEIPEEEEPLQGKMTKTIQLQEIPEEEEPLQGKFESIQRQDIPEEEDPLQGKFENNPEQEICPSCSTLPIQRAEENRTGMPDDLKAGVENLSGIDMSDVRVHYNSDKPANVGALAYTQGTDIHVAPGQERHLPHEAWHVVQQKERRVQPIIQMQEGMAINDDKKLETEADMMGTKAKLYSMECHMKTGKHTLSKVEKNIPNNNYSPHRKERSNATNYNQIGQILKKKDRQKTDIIQLHTIAVLTHHDQSVTERSRKDVGRALDGINECPLFHTQFVGNVHPQTVYKRDRTISQPDPRPIGQCAEPHALGQIINIHRDEVNTQWLNDLRFESIIDEKTSEPIRPCAVCSQWTDGIRINQNLIPQNIMSIYDLMHERAREIVSDIETEGTEEWQGIRSKITDHLVDYPHEQMIYEFIKGYHDRAEGLTKNDLTDIGRTYGFLDQHMR